MIRTFALLAAMAATVFGVPVNVCDNEGVKPFTNINNNFGNGMLELLGDNEDNLFFSPSSISSVLSAIFFGAKGETAEKLIGLGYLSIQYENMSAYSPLLGHCLELLTTLRSTSDDYTLERANALLSQKDYPLLDEYKENLRKYFGALAKEVDFAEQSEKVVRDVNEWVSQKTHGKISKLVDELDESTRLLLLNAIYFKGTWQTEFDPEHTKPRPFYNNGGSSSKSVPIMTVKSKFPFLYDGANRYRALQLPYKGNDVSMLILLPFERDGIEDLQKTLSMETISDVLKRVQETEVTVSLPKFRIEYSRYLKDDLTRGGLGAMFSNDADFSGMTGGKDLYVSDIVHKAVIEVNEEGSEAAAVTGGIVVPVSLPLPELRNEFNADHPFLFYIIDNRSSSNLFVGRVNEL